MQKLVKNRGFAMVFGLEAWLSGLKLVERLIKGDEIHVVGPQDHGAELRKGAETLVLEVCRAETQPFGP